MWQCVALTSPPSPSSAGVGRTGTFITIDHVLEQIEKEGVVGIPGVIQKIRDQRMKMVQTVVCSVSYCMCMNICVQSNTGWAGVPE